MKKAPKSIIEKQIVLEPTADGSMTLYRPDIDEHYGSTKGAAAESLHVYVDCCVRHVAATSCSGGPLRVLELGFGTGLNAAMTVDAVDCPVEYVSLELFPVGEDELLKLGYEEFASHWPEVVRAPWNTRVEITPLFTLEKRRANFLSEPLPAGLDAIYYDAFAPEKQPELWTLECFARVFEALRPGGVLTTYCAKGVVRRGLEAAGFVVERLAGPVGGKREILRATKPE